VLSAISVFKYKTRHEKEISHFILTLPPLPQAHYEPFLIASKGGLNEAYRDFQQGKGKAPA
jgi:redox-sensitive bicupin YhaK (pirin superfamily)